MSINDNKLVFKPILMSQMSQTYICKQILWKYIKSSTISKEQKIHDLHSKYL